MKASVGVSKAKNPSTSALEISNQIKATSAPLGDNDFILAFCNSGIDSDIFFSQLRDAFGKTPVIGGGVIGVITNDQHEYQDPVAGAMLIQGNNYTFRYDYVDNFIQNEIESGEKLINRIAVEKGDKALITFFESTAIEGTEDHPPMLNESTLLCDGIYKKLPVNILLTGAGLIGSYDFGKTSQFCGDKIGKDTASGVMLGGPIKPYCKIFHGCTPLDGIYHTITKIKDGVIQELDGNPIVPMIDALHQDKSWREERPIKFLTLGANKGEKFSDFSEDNYINRLIVGMSPDGNGIIPLESYFQEGDEIQFMLRDNNKMIETAKEGSKELIDEILADNNTPCFAFYIDCAGRAADFCNSLSEEVAEVQHYVNKNDIPLLGIYSGVELAPFNNRSIGLDWTGVLFILAEE